MPWWYIRNLLGPGLHWGRSEEELLAAIQRAEADHMPAAAQHLRYILEMNRAVNMRSSERMFPDEPNEPAQN